MITRRHYFCDMCTLYINRIQRALLQKEKKEGHKDLSFSLEKHRFCALCAALSFSVNCASTLSEKWGKRERTKRNERKKEKREKREKKDAS